MVEPTSHEENLRALRQAIETLLNRSDGPLAAVAKEAKARLELLAVRLASRDEQDRLAALYHVSRALGSSLQLDQALNQVMDAVIQLTGAERGFLMLLDRETGELDLQAARNFERKNLDREDMQVSRTVIKEVVRTGEGLVTTNAQTDARFAQQPSVMRYALRSILCVPLRARGEVSGVIYVDNTVKAALFSEREREMLEAFAAQAAVALENARLYTRTDTALAERVAELETLQRLDRELNAGLDFERVLDLTLDWAVRGTQAESGWIAMRSGDSQTMSIVAGAGKGAALDPTWLPSAAAPPGAARPMPFLGGNGSGRGAPSPPRAPHAECRFWGETARPTVLRPALTRPPPPASRCPCAAKRRLSHGSASSATESRSRRMRRPSSNAWPSTPPWPSRTHASIRRSNKRTWPSRSSSPLSPTRSRSP